MNEQIRQLVEIQDLDNEIHELREQINRYPGIWAEMKDELRKKSEAVEQARRAITSHEEERRKVEQEMRLAGEKLVSYQAQQMLVKTSKELAAISSQIDTLKKRIDRLHEVGEALLNEDENVRARVGKAEEELATAKAAAREERDRIRNQVKTKKQRIQTLSAERERIAAELEDNYISRYDRVRNRWESNPIVPVRNGSCTGCNFALLANRLVELHRADGIVYCDNCGRILSEDETYEVSVAVD